MRSFTVTLVQMAPVLIKGMGLAEKVWNVERAAELLRAEWHTRVDRCVSGRWTDLVVLPEFIFDGPASTIGSLALSAENVTGGPAVDACTDLAHELDAPILVPVYLGEEGAFYNSCMVVGPGVSGERVYRKMHTFPPEAARVRRGGEFSLAVVGGARVGLQICYDLAFPEAARVLRLRGAEVIVYPTMAPEWLMARFQVLAAARAIENQVFVAVVNAVGEHPRTGERLSGGSVVAWPDGRTLVLGKEETVLTVAFDLDELDTVRAGLDMTADRVPAMYVGLVGVSGAVE